MFLLVRVLQHRSVAFVTFVSEFGAQFAKEAMACQSLDNDEILNVRWATEDPNPTQKVAEKEWLEKMGSEAIQGKVDERIVDAMRSIRALEEEAVLQDEDEIETEQQHPPRLRDSEDDSAESQPDRKRQRIEPPPQSPQTNGLLQADTLESLKYFAQIRDRNVAAKAAAPPVRAGLLGVGGYGSDDE